MADNDLSPENVVDALLFAEESVNFIINTWRINKLAHVFNLASIPTRDLDDEKGTVKENSLSHLRITTLIKIIKGRSLFLGLNPRVIPILGNRADNIYYIAVVMNPRPSVCAKMQNPTPNPSPQPKSDSDDLIDLDLGNLNGCDDLNDFVFSWDDLGIISTD